MVDLDYLRYRILLSIITLFLLADVSHAVIAYPYGIKQSLADGRMVTVFLRGDEYNKWAVSEDGYTLLRDRAGDWCYATKGVSGQLEPSVWKLTSVSDRADELSAFLKQTPKMLTVIPKESQRRPVISAKSASAFLPVVGKQKTLVILMQFRNTSLKKLKADFVALFNQPGYSDDGAKGSVRDFYLENSSGLLDLNCDVIGPFTSSEDMEYYGGNDMAGNDMHPEALFMEALKMASLEVNLADYDPDKDGYINNIHLIYAGYGEEAGASASAIWAHEATFYEPIMEQGMKISGYSCAPELRGNMGKGISRIGVHCHEIGHSFGALDFYDTNYAVGGEFEGTGKWDLMASGSWNNEGILPAHFNPYSKTYTFGWSVCETLSEDETPGVLSPVTNSNQIYRIDTNTPGEFFLIENRQQQGFDQSLPGSGLMIYHIHSQIESGFKRNKINATYPQMCYPVCATAPLAMPNKNASSYGYINSPSCSFGSASGKTEFTGSTIPAAYSWDGNTLDLQLTDITQLVDGNVSFKARKGQTTETGKLLLSEGFENGVSDWTLLQPEGTVGWNVYENVNLGGTTSSMPDAAEGSTYMYMKATKLSSFSHICRLLSPVIDFSKVQNAALSFKCQNISVNQGKGALNVLYRNNMSGNWKLLISITEAISDWKEYTLQLPDLAGNYQLAFEGNMKTGFILLDDIRICSAVATSTSATVKTPAITYFAGNGFIHVTSDVFRLLKIYTLTGRLIQSCNLNPGVNRIELPSGFYIGKYDQGAIKLCVN